MTKAHHDALFFWNLAKKALEVSFTNKLLIGQKMGLFRKFEFEHFPSSNVEVTKELMERASQANRLDELAVLLTKNHQELFTQ